MVVIEIEAQQLQENNLKWLKARKTEFKQHLIRSFSLGGYVFIVLLYLKDTSFIRFGIRLLLHGIYGDPFPSRYSYQFTQNTRKGLTKSMFYMAIAINSIFFITDLISGVPKPLDDDNYLYGSVTLQIIGDTRPNTRFAYVYYNILISISQLILIYLSAVLNIEEDMEESNKPSDRAGYTLNQIEGDGSGGITNVTKIKPIEIFNKVSSYQPDTTQDTNNETTYNDYVADRLNISNMAL